mgnify:CR=1 FL=1
MDLTTLETPQLVSLYSSVIKELKNRGVIRTNNVIGDLGEYLAIAHYNNTPGLPMLAAAPIGTENVDAISRKGDRYSIKATSRGTTGVFYGLEPKGSTAPDRQKFEYVIICRFNGDYELDTILEMDWETFLKHKKWCSRQGAWNIHLNKGVCADSKIIYQK